LLDLPFVVSLSNHEREISTTPGRFYMSIEPLPKCAGRRVSSPVGHRGAAEMSLYDQTIASCYAVQ